MKLTCVGNGEKEFGNLPYKSYFLLEYPATETVRLCQKVVPELSNVLFSDLTNGCLCYLPPDKAAKITPVTIKEIIYEKV